MPCDLGYRSRADVRIQAPSKEPVQSRTKALDLDAELADRLGEEDPAFLDWLVELDAGPLLEKALERALAALQPGPSFSFRIANGTLAGSTSVAAGAEAVFERVAARWQLELLGIAGEILDYALSLEVAREGGREVWTLSGEKTTSSGVREFLRISLDASGKAQIAFEHFKSRRALELEEARFYALAHRLGVRIAVGRRERGGQDIPEGAINIHAIKGKGKP
jgi:hypothetical protein